MTNLAKRRRALMMSQGGAPEPPFYINGYIGNGLIEYFDAIDNKGIGNPRSSGSSTQQDAKMWLNYQGTNKPGLFEYGTNVWTADARHVQNWRSAMKWEYNFLAGLNSFTVEARFKQGNYGNPGCCFSVANGATSGRFLEISATQTVGYIYGPDTISKELPFPSGINTLAVTCGKGKIKFFVNGEFVDERAISDSAFANIVDDSRKTVSGTAWYNAPATAAANQW